MDHAYLLTWGLMPEVGGHDARHASAPPGSAICAAAPSAAGRPRFAVDIHNDGWGWATGSPYTDLIDLVDHQNKFGADLRRELVDRISRQLLLAFMVELLPDPSNRVTVDRRYKDPLGNMRPVLSYTMPDYTMAGVAYARGLVAPDLPAARRRGSHAVRPDGLRLRRAIEGEGYVIRGGNHWSGTHMMGTTPANSVVDADQRSWDHENLYLVGAGSMPSIGTSNTTLTLAALCLRSAEHMVEQLRRDIAASSSRRQGDEP